MSHECMQFQKHSASRFLPLAQVPQRSWHVSGHFRQVQVLMMFLHLGVQASFGTDSWASQFVLQIPTKQINTSNFIRYKCWNNDGQVKNKQVVQSDYNLNSKWQSSCVRFQYCYEVFIHIFMATTSHNH